MILRVRRKVIDIILCSNLKVRKMRGMEIKEQVAICVNCTGNVLLLFLCCVYGVMLCRVREGDKLVTVLLGSEIGIFIFGLQWVCIR